jgi:FMNH2-dependent dimethyl sulfone monooxygenase
MTDRAAHSRRGGGCWVGGSEQTALVAQQQPAAPIVAGPGVLRGPKRWLARCITQPGVDVKFGYWMPLGSGGMVISSLPQRTDWTLAWNARMAAVAENVGYDYGLAPARFIASHGWEFQQEATVCTSVLATQTKRLKLITAVHTGLWHPAMIAKQGATIDVYSGGRFAINVLTGWFKDEYLAFGVPWLEHDERYRKSEEFIQILKGLWTQERFDFKGFFFNINNAWLEPRPVSKPHPEIFQGGNSKAARRMAGRYSDWYFMNGNSVEKIKEQIEDVSAIARAAGRRVKFGLNGFVIQRDTEREALDQLETIIASADPAVVKAFGDQVKQAGASTQEKIGMWADSGPANLVQPNDGFKTRLIGPAEVIAERIKQYYEVGVDLILTAFLHYEDELPRFGRTVIPLVQEMNVRRADRLAAQPIVEPPRIAAAG